jgi:hypothetical protein
MGIVSVDFDASGQLLIIHSAFVKCLRKKWAYNKAVHQLVIEFKTAYDSVRREVLYISPFYFGIPMKLERKLKMCLNETYSTVRVGKHV